jgi:hypothetical protein
MELLLAGLLGYVAFLLIRAARGQVHARALAVNTTLAVCGLGGGFVLAGPSPSCSGPARSSSPTLPTSSPPPKGSVRPSSPTAWARALASPLPA